VRNEGEPLLGLQSQLLL